MVSSTLNVALAQFGPGTEPGPVISQAKAEGAAVVVFPEMFSNGYASFDPDDPDAERTWRQGGIASDDPFIGRFREAARSHGIHVVATFLEAGPDPFNSALLIDPGGAIVAHHRKVHICDFDAPEKACGRGKGFDVTRLSTGAGPVTVGLMICMDREYADGAGALSAAGAELILVPNACELVADPVVGDVRIAQLRGRAFETATGIAVANYPPPKHDGHSVAVGPQGEILVMAGDAPGLVHARFNLAAIRQVRAADWFRWQRVPTGGHANAG
jgi:predicted amidohydrolase